MRASLGARPKPLRGIFLLDSQRGYGRRLVKKAKEFGLKVDYCSDIKEFFIRARCPLFFTLYEGYVFEEEIDFQYSGSELFGYYKRHMGDGLRILLKDRWQNHDILRHADFIFSHSKDPKALLQCFLYNQHKPLRALA